MVRFLLLDVTQTDEMPQIISLNKKRREEKRREKRREEKRREEKRSFIIGTVIKLVIQSRNTGVPG